MGRAKGQKRGISVNAYKSHKEKLGHTMYMLLAVVPALYKKTGKGKEGLQHPVTLVTVTPKNLNSLIPNIGKVTPRSLGSLNPWCFSKVMASSAL